MLINSQGWFHDHRGKYLLFLRLALPLLDLVSFGFEIGCLISLQFKHNIFNSFLARSGSEIYFPQEDADPPRPISLADTSSEM